MYIKTGSPISQSTRKIQNISFAHYQYVHRMKCIQLTHNWRVVLCRCLSVSLHLASSNNWRSSVRPSVCLHVAAPHLLDAFRLTIKLGCLRGILFEIFVIDSYYPCIFNMPFIYFSQQVIPRNNSRPPAWLKRCNRFYHLQLSLAWIIFLYGECSF